MVPRLDLTRAWFLDVDGDGEDDLLSYDPTYPSSFVLLPRIPGGAFAEAQLFPLDETACVPLEVVAVDVSDGADSPGVIAAGKDCLSLLRFGAVGNGKPKDMVTERTIQLQDVVPGYIAGDSGTPVAGNFQFDEVKEILYPELGVLVPFPLVIEEGSSAMVSKVVGVKADVLMAARDLWEPGFSSLIEASGTMVSVQSMWNDGEFEQDCYVELTTDVVTLGPMVGGSVFVAGEAMKPTAGVPPADFGSRVVGMKLENGGFSVEQAAALQGTVTCLAAGDIDGDGDIEALAGGEIKPAAKVNTPFENNPSLGYLAVMGFPRISDAEPQTFIVSPFVPSAVMVVDLDGNGKPDIVASGMGGMVWWNQE